MPSPLPKLVTNRHRETALAGPASDGYIDILRMDAGALSVEQLLLSDFEENWFELHYPLPQAMAKYLQHAHTFGASPAALAMLTPVCTPSTAPLPSASLDDKE